MLNQDDVARLGSESSAEVRAETARKVGTQFSAGSLGPRERALAEDIFRLMLRDAEVRVRAALSDTLKDNPAIPHDVAIGLARDVDEVALPVLQFSEVLTDDDLLEIVRTRPADSQIAVAKRRTVSSEVSDALAATGDEGVVSTLVGNQGADIREGTLERIVEEFSDSDRVKETLAARPALPIAIAERLITFVSDRLRRDLENRTDLVGSLSDDLFRQSREKATIGLLSPGQGHEAALQLVRQLQDNGRLTSTIILRALCSGNLAFFVAALAMLSRVPFNDVFDLVHDTDSGLGDIYGRARLPKSMLGAVRTAMEVVKETDFDAGPQDRERYQRRVIERFLTQFEGLDSENLDYLLARLEGVNKEESIAAL